MKIAVRLDDITPDMDWKKFLAFKELLDRYGIKPLIGVVPQNEDSNLCCDEPKCDFWNYLKELQEQGWVIAMHGYRHIYDSNRGGMFPLNHFSEFAGHSLDIQTKRIKAGRELFCQKGIETDIFMPPAHSYDEYTLEALKKNGFTRITDGFGVKPYWWRELIFYPISFRLGSSLKKERGYTTMVVHTNTIEDMAYYDGIFKEHGEQFIDYEEYLQVKPEKRTVLGQKQERLMAGCKHFLVKLTSK